MARTLEREEESRIEELERLAREGDETDKLIAELQLTEERERVARDAEKAVLEEELTPAVTPSNAVMSLGKRTEKETQEAIEEAIKELPENKKERKPPEIEEVFSAETIRAHRDKVASELAAKSAADYADAEMRLRKDSLEKYPRATIGQKVKEGLSLGLITPATKANADSAAYMGATIAEFQARMKVDKATSSARSARIGAAIGGVETKAIVDVMTGMSSNANLKYFNEYRAKTGSFFANLLNVGSDATPSEEKAAQERVIYLAREGNKSALLQAQALAKQYNALAEARKLQGTRDHAAAVERAKAIRSENAAAQQLYYTNQGQKAVDENGIFQRTLLSDDVLEMMYDKDGSLTLQGAQVLAGGDDEVIEHNDAIRTQIFQGRSEYESVSNELNNLQGIEGKSFDSMSLKEKISATNPNNITGLKDKLKIVNDYITATEGEPPEFVKNNINFRNDLLKQKSELQSELNDEGTSVLRKGAIKLTLGMLNRNLAKTNTAIKTSYNRMAATTNRINESGKTEVELEKARLLARQKDGQDRMDEFRKLVEPDEAEANRMGVQTDGIGKGGGFFEFAFFERDPDTGKYTDVKWQFRPWLGTHTQASKGGVPARELKMGVIPDDLKKISNAYVWDEAEQQFVRKQGVAQKKIYAGALKQWKEAYEKPVAPASTAPTTPALTTPAEPLTVPMAPASVAGPVAPHVVSTPPPPATPEELPFIELEATNVMEGVRADASGRPYKDGDAVKFSDPRYPESVRGRTFIFKTDSVWGNPYWLLKPE